MPDVSDIPIGPLGWFGKLKQSTIGPSNALYGMYNPFTGKVEMNPSLVGSPDYEDTLVHELTHAKQRKQQGFFGNMMSIISGEGEPYNRRPSELEAYQAETDYRRNQGLPIAQLIRPTWDQPEDTRNWFQRFMNPAPIQSISRADINLR